MSKINLFDSYLAYDTKYRELYGPNTIIWMETGGFIEMYSKSETDPQMLICSKLNLHVTKRN